jgi:hypothetical protein
MWYVTCGGVRHICVQARVNAERADELAEAAEVERNEAASAAKLAEADRLRVGDSLPFPPYVYTFVPGRFADEVVPI